MSFKVLLADDLRSWLRPRSIALVLAACLIPPALTAAWVFTHQADVAASDVSYGPDPLVAGQLANITATVRNAFGTSAGASNVTVQVGYFENRTGSLRFQSLKDQTFPVPALPAGASASFTMNWSAQPGTFIFRALADADDRLPEIEERNNERFVQAQVPFPTLKLDLPPPGTRNGNATQPAASLRLENVTWPALHALQDGSIHVAVSNAGPAAANATVKLDVHAATPLGYYPATPTQTLRQDVVLLPGNRTQVDFSWTPPAVNQYAFVATVETASQHDLNLTDNAIVQQAFVDRQFLYQEPPPKATAKDFYRSTLEGLHLKLLIPLVALFYAAGLLEEERTRGSLPYLLTRPVPRWQIPLARFLAMAIVGTIATLAGIVATYILLLGLPQDAGGFFLWPLVFGTACLLVYGALFTAVGVAARRPYLVSLAYLLGVETLLFLGSSILVNGRPLVQGWVGDLSLTNWMVRAFHGWDPGRGWVPHGQEALQALGVMAGVAVASLAVAVVAMRKREFVR